MSGVVVRAIGVVTGWGRGVEALSPEPARATTVVAARPAARTGERLRRATRECLLAVDAVEALLEDGGLTRENIAGAGTALVYVTAAAYGASNRAFIDGGGALHFPYTAPSAVPAEVAIAFGLHGPYAVLIGGAATTIDAIDHARVLLARGACERALVLAVETFEECADLLARGGIMEDGPLVEAAVAALFLPDAGDELAGSRASPARSVPAVPVGQTFACAPLIALAIARARGERVSDVRGVWRGREATTTVGVAEHSPGWKER